MMRGVMGIHVAPASQGGPSIFTMSAVTSRPVVSMMARFNGGLNA